MLKEKGIKTFVTLVHFSVPQWFAKKGDFQKRDNLLYFERYLKYILPRISPYVDFRRTLCIHQDADAADEFLSG